MCAAHHVQHMQCCASLGMLSFCRWCDESHSCENFILRVLFECGLCAQISQDVCYDVSYQSQAGALGDAAEQVRRKTKMGYMVFGLFLTVPLIPLALLCAWRIGRHYLFATGAGSDSSAGSEVGVGAVAEAKEDSVSMPGATSLASPSLCNSIGKIPQESLKTKQPSHPQASTFNRIVLHSPSALF